MWFMDGIEDYVKDQEKIQLMIDAAPKLLEAALEFEKAIQNTSIFSPDEFKAWCKLLNAISFAVGEG